MGNTSGLAITALILGICSLILGWIPIVGWAIVIAGFIISIIAIKKISKNNKLGGRGMGIAGLVMSSISLFFFVILMGIGSLAYFGALSPDRFMPSKCVISGGFSCTEFNIKGDVIQINVQNNLGVDANAVTITMTGTSGSTCTASYGPVAIKNGATTGLQRYACNPVIAGTKYKGNIIMTYTRTGETATHTTTGSISGSVE